MKIKIAGTTFDKFSQVNINLIYDSVASTFSCSVYFDPNNAAQKAALQPGKFPPVTIEHNGVLLLTGTLLSLRFKSSAKPRHLVHLSGYSTTGVLEDCQIPESIYPLQSNNLSFSEIVSKVIQPFGLKLVVDPSVRDACNKPINVVNADANQTIKSYLAEIAGQINVVVSHTNKGELLLTGYKTKDTNTILANYATVPVDPALSGVSGTASGTVIKDKKAIINFTQGMPGVEFELIFDGQQMHSTISVNGQHPVDEGNAQSVPALRNPYVGISNTIALLDQNDINNAQIYGTVQTVPRPKIAIPTASTDLTLEKAQRNILSGELKAIPLKIEMRGWSVNGAMIMPGDIITVKNIELHIYETARFFIESAVYKGNHVKETVTLNCVVPETFNNDMPKNIFA